MGRMLALKRLILYHREANERFAMLSIVYSAIFFKVVSINRTKEEIAEYGLGFMVHDKQIRPLCGQVNSKEEQLFGYEVTVYRK